MIRRDLDCVADVQFNSVGDVIDRSTLLSWLREGSVIGVVAEIGNAIVGYAIYDIGRTYIDVRHLRVHEAFAGHGIGRSLVDFMARRLVGKRKALRVVVGDDRLDAHLFLRACGFVATRVVKGVFDDEYCFELYKQHAQENELERSVCPEIEK